MSLFSEKNSFFQLDCIFPNCWKVNLKLGGFFMTTESKNDVEKGKQVININGGIHAGRDVVMRDQINYGTVADIQSPTQFAAALQNV